MANKTTKKRAFISFDYDNDAFLKEALVGQAKHEDTPFELTDHSLKEALTGDWKKKVTPRIKGVDVVVIMCGEHTDTAAGIAAELAIAQEHNVPYFLLKGYADKTCKWPKGCKSTDKMYNWTWDNLKALFNGSR